MHWNPAIGIPLIIAGIIVLVLVWLFGQPRRAGHGHRRTGHEERREPQLTATSSTAEAESGQPAEEEISVAPETTASRRVSASASPAPTPVSNPPTAAKPVVSGAGLGQGHVAHHAAGHKVERIVSLFVVGRKGGVLRGPDIVVAMDKAGIVFGEMAIYHRMLDGKTGAEAVFSVANMVKPGSFDLATMTEFTTPGLSFFMTLPGPLPALDAWDTMLPTAQRVAGLLEGMVLDERRNALGRQGIAFIRDELRGWDRHHGASGPIVRL